MRCKIVNARLTSSESRSVRSFTDYDYIFSTFRCNLDVLVRFCNRGNDSREPLAASLSGCSLGAVDYKEIPRYLYLIILYIRSVLTELVCTAFVRKRFPMVDGRWLNYR